MSMSELAERMHALESRLDDMARSHAKVEQERDEYKKLVHLLQEQNEKLRRGLFGQKAERLPKNDAQLSLSILQLALGGAEADGHNAEAHDAEENDEQTIAEHSRKRPVRKPLGEHWPRVTVEILPQYTTRGRNGGIMMAIAFGTNLFFARSMPHTPRHSSSATLFPTARAASVGSSSKLGSKLNFTRVRRQAIAGDR
jgi:hypothetical protein